MDISIVVPVYNVEKYVRRCLESIAAQTYVGTVECIVVADSPTDGSMRVVEAFVAQYKGTILFRLLYHPFNKGLAAARNTGVAAATGDYIFHLDSDDYCDADALEKMYAKAVETDADIVVTDYWETYEDHEEYHSNRVPQTREARVRGMLWRTYAQVMYSKLIRREVYTENGLTQVEGLDYGEDILMTVVLMYYAEKVVHLESAFVHHIHYNQNSYTFALAEKSIRQLVAVDKAIDDFILEKADCEVFRDDLLRSKLANYFFLLHTTSPQQKKIWMPYFRNISQKSVLRNPEIPIIDKVQFFGVNIGYVFGKPYLAWRILCYARHVGRALKRKIT